MKRVISAILVAVLLVACLPVTAALAAEPVQTYAQVEKLQVSEKLIAMIKEEEGFSATPYWDYSQYSIGYGCAVKNKNGQRVYTRAEADAIYPNGITREEADALLREEVKENYAAPVNNFAINRGFAFNQNQFDALVSFTYNVGSVWMQKQYRVVRWIEENLTKNRLTADEELDFVSSIGAWCRAGDEILPALCRRRINEAKMFLFGVYSGETTPRDFSYAIYHAQRSTMSNGYEDMAEYYIRGVKMGELPIPNEAAGYTFTGWALSGGSAVTSSTIAQSQSMIVYAQWKAGSDSTDPTEPEPTEPDPTEPEPTEPEKLPYDDVEDDDWYASAVRFVYEQGLFYGTSDSTFGPQDNMSRAMLVTVLWRRAGRPTASQEAGFEDVPETDDESCYYAVPVAWAKEYGIVAGVSESEFGPDRSITREQLAAILYRYCTVYWGVQEGKMADLAEFTDGDQVSAYAEEAMQWAVGNGIVSGMGNGTLNPKGTAIRAQVASMIQRTVENILT